MVEQVLRKYLDPRTASEALAKAKAGHLSTHSAFITVMCLRVAHFDKICQQLGDERAADLLNAYYAAIFPILAKYNAVVNEILGPACFVLWGAPTPLAESIQGMLVGRAVEALWPALRSFAASARDQFGVDFQVRAGVHSGPAQVGLIGSPERMTYAAVGWTVEVAWALLEEAERRGLPLLLSGETGELLPGEPPMDAAGKVVIQETPLEVYTFGDR